MHANTEYIRYSHGGSHYIWNGSIPNAPSILHSTDGAISASTATVIVAEWSFTIVNLLSYQPGELSRSCIGAICGDALILSWGTRMCEIHVRATIRFHKIGTAVDGESDFIVGTLRHVLRQQFADREGCYMLEKVPLILFFSWKVIGEA